MGKQASVTENPRTIEEALSASAEAYADKYSAGYALMYPDGHVIRFYEKFLKYELGIDGSNHEKILDFGCGNGVHSQYLSTKGFKVHGCDVVPQVIDYAKKWMPGRAEQFKLIKPNEDIQQAFSGVKFDIIFSNQVLYYLSDTNLEKTLNQFNEMLNPDGIVYFTMIGTGNYYYGCSKERNDLDGFREVTLTGRLNDTTYIGFTRDEEHLKQKFHMFDPHFVSYYDNAGREGSGLHYQFLGLKKGYSKPKKTA